MCTAFKVCGTSTWQKCQTPRAQQARPRSASRSGGQGDDPARPAGRRAPVEAEGAPRPPVEQDLGAQVQQRAAAVHQRVHHRLRRVAPRSMVSCSTACARAPRSACRLARGRARPRAALCPGRRARRGMDGMGGVRRGLPGKSAGLQDGRPAGLRTGRLVSSPRWLGREAACDAHALRPACLPTTRPPAHTSCRGAALP